MICYREDVPPFGDEEMKIKVRAGRVIDITKAMDPQEADGENVGIVKFGAAGAALLSRQMGLLITKGAYRSWAPRAFREFAKMRPLHVIGTRGLPWIEIDFPDDYHKAIDYVLPEIETAEPSFDRGIMLAAAAQ